MAEHSKGKKVPPKPRSKFPGIQARWSSKEGCWRFRARVKVLGLQKVSPYYATQEEAYETGRSMRMELQGLDQQGVTIGDAAEAVLRAAQNRGQTRDQALHNYGAPLDFIKSCCDPTTPLSEIAPEDINDYINAALEHGRSNNTIKQKDLPMLSQFFKLAGLTDVTRDPKVRKLRLIKPKTRHLEPAEIRQILKDIRQKPIKQRVGRGKNTAVCEYPNREWHADIIEFVATTGIRSGEFSRLTVEAVDWREREIDIAKTKDRFNPRVIEITDHLEPIVHRLCERAEQTEDRLLVPGGMDFAAQICKRWRTRLKSVHFTMRILRHSFGSALVEQGVPLSDVADLMGHSDVTTTSRYVHATSNRKKRKRNADVMSRLLAPDD